MIDLRVACDQAEHDRDADARSDVAREAEDTGGLGSRRSGQGRVGESRNRHEDQTEAKALDDADVDDRPHRHIRTELRAHTQRECNQQDADRHWLARINAALEQSSNDGH